AAARSAQWPVQQLVAVANKHFLVREDRRGAGPGAEAIARHQLRFARWLELCGLAVANLNRSPSAASSLSAPASSLSALRCAAVEPRLIDWSPSARWVKAASHFLSGQAPKVRPSVQSPADISLKPPATASICSSLSSPAACCRANSSLMVASYSCAVKAKP